MKNKLNKEQIAILEHTLRNRIYCGDSEDMSNLCDKGLMKFMFRKSYVPDGYYQITREGKNAI
jgi:hypothetical protein